MAPGYLLLAPLLINLDEFRGWQTRIRLGPLIFPPAAEHCTKAWGLALLKHPMSWNHVVRSKHHPLFRLDFFWGVLSSTQERPTECSTAEVMPRWLLYYSASSVFRRKDSKNPPPMYIGIAAAPAVEGPYRRINEKPFLGTSEGVPQVIGPLALLGSADLGKFSSSECVKRIIKDDLDCFRGCWRAINPESGIKWVDSTWLNC